MRPIPLCRKTRRDVELTERENERVVQKIIEAVNRHDTDAMMDHVADDVMRVGASGTRYDNEGIRKEFADVLASFPDISIRVDRMMSKGNTVWTEGSFSGTHKGELFGIPATNKKVGWPVVWIFDFEAGKVKLWKEYFNFQIVIQQLRG